MPNYYNLKTITIIIFFSFLISNKTTYALENELSNTEIVQSQYTITVAKGIFKPRRELFYEMYGNGSSIFAMFEKKISSRLRIGATIGFSKTRDEDFDFDFSSYTLAPILSLTLMENNFIEFSGFGGIGVSKSKLRTKVVRFNNTIRHFTRSENGKFTLAGIKIMKSFTRVSSFLIQIHYTNHFTGSPEIGDFGDIGGFFLQGGIQFNL